MTNIAAHHEFTGLRDRKPRFLTAGDSGLVVEFGADVDLATNARVLNLDRHLWSTRIFGLLETVPTYRSLMISFDPAITDHDAVIRMVEASLAHTSAEPTPTTEPRQWLIPVVYGGDAGPDLAHVAQHCELSEDEVISQHRGSEYPVFMIGFNPGFPYMGGLPRALHIPRRAVPIPHVEPGCIIIGGGQAAITSVATPTGWYVIGRTPVKPFDLSRSDTPFLFEAGDLIRFRSIRPEDYAAYEAAPMGGAICQEGDAR